MRRSASAMGKEEHHIVLNRIFHVVPRKGIRILTHQLQCVRTRLLQRDLAGNALLRHIFGTHAQRQALTKRTGLKQVGNADLVTAGRALKHTLGR